MSYRRFSIFVVGVIACGLCTTAFAQQLPKKERGFRNVARAIASGEESTTQENLWILEVQYKSLRMLAVDITNPKTGERKPKFVWYFVYKVLNRPIPKKVDDTDTAAINEFDPPPGPPIFAPEFLLVTKDGNEQVTHRDVIVPEAQAAIQRRERQKFLNTVQMVGELPKLSGEDDEEDPRYGVAMFTGIDPRTDYFTLILNGFSNGYRYVRGPATYDELTTMVQDDSLKASDHVWDGKTTWMPAEKLGDLFDELQDPPENADQMSWFYTVSRDRFTDANKPLVWRKTLKIEYWRPGDRFDQSEVEFRQQGEPAWIYRADEPMDDAAADAGTDAPADAGPDAAAAPPAANN
ncbi:MAG: hypothetical protein CMJ78_24935 [Planctomycetaceae bacterium]|nr:hypothetical protein [Planctomycetaceae bacterium]